jgi:glutathione S-transferase
MSVPPPAIAAAPVLFGLERSVYTRIARLALEEKGVNYSLQEVEIFGSEGVPDEHLKRHPFGRIPVLQHGAFFLYETQAITRYVDETFPGQALQPEHPQHRARMAQVISLLDSYAYRPMVWGAFVQRVRIPRNGGVANKAVITESLQSGAKCLAAIVEIMGDNAFIAGDHISLADLHAFPMLRYFSLAPEGRALMALHSTIKRWYDAMLMRESVKRTITLYEIDHT